jgi:diguanylate cyclase (GGDEF)-like protein
MIAQKKIAFKFPSPLEERFIFKRAKDSQAFIHTGRYLLVLLFMTICLNVAMYFTDIVFYNNFEVVKSTYIPLATAIAFIILSPRLDIIQRYFYYFMTPVSIFVLHIIIKLSIIYDGDYSDFVVYHLMTAIILMAFGLRFVLPLFIIVLVSAAGLSIMHASYNGISINHSKFSNYYIVYSLVVMALAAISEWHERIAFLQSLLLTHQTEELKKLNEELDHIAHEDALTGIANRRSFDDLSRKEWDRGLRDQQPLTLLLLDVDFFKKYNDFYGHGEGDRCLHNIGQVLKASIMRTSDVVARYGGEEFAILLPNTKASGGVQVAERVTTFVDGLAITHDYSDAATHVTISIGIATITANTTQSMSDLLKQADIALYQAKANGRHQFVVYQPPETTAATIAEASSIT